MKKLVAAIALLCLLLPGLSYAEDELLSFNKASAEEIAAALEGIVDIDLAEAIVKYRDANGPFVLPEDLLKVPGMRSLIYNSIAPFTQDDDVVYEDVIPQGMHAY